MSFNPGAKLGPTILGLTRLVDVFASSLDLTLSPSAFAEASADPPKSFATKGDEGGLGEFGVKKGRAAVNVVRRQVRGHGS
jgi:hypothetical protein